MSASTISLYIHIPFCAQKCLYCDFLSAPQTAETRAQYTKALRAEIRCAGRVYGKETGPGRVAREVDTIFFGGGTPSILSPGEICGILDTIRDSFYVRPDAEISMEANPGTLPDGTGTLTGYREAGINRLSLGVQSLHDDELRFLGRIHTARQARDTFRQAREAGFENINVDLMCALPSQTLDSWMASLQGVAGWGPEHISAYSLILEPGTPFFYMWEQGLLPPLPGEEEDREMYARTGRFLREHGYRQYEISNYARPGRECRHNLGCWTGLDYLGFGIGAASCTDHTRFSNTEDLAAYMQMMNAGDLAACTQMMNTEDLTACTQMMNTEDLAACTQMMNTGKEAAAEDREKSGDNYAAVGKLRRIRRHVHRLSIPEQMEEFMFLGLRMTDGVCADTFEKRFGQSMEAVYGDVLRRHIAQGVLARTEEGVRLTPRGIDVSNYVLADYLLDE